MLAGLFYSACNSSEDRVDWNCENKPKNTGELGVMYASEFKTNGNLNFEQLIKNFGCPTTVYDMGEYIDFRWYLKDSDGSFWIRCKKGEIHYVSCDSTGVDAAKNASGMSRYLSGPGVCNEHILLLDPEARNMMNLDKKLANEYDILPLE